MIFEKTPEMIALGAFVDQKREIVEAAKLVLNAAHDEYVALEQAWWDENLEKFEPDNVEDLRELSKRGWNFGSGNQQATEYLRKWMSSHSPYLHLGGWLPITDDRNNYEDYVAAFSVHLPDTIDEDEKETLANALTKMFGLFNQICHSEEGYKVKVYSDIFTRRDDDEGVTHILSAFEDDIILTIKHYYYQEDVVEGKALEIIDYLYDKETE